MPTDICKIDGCDGKKFTSGLCSKHYGRWQRTGDPEVLVNPWGTPTERFWRHVNKAEPDKCWEWTAFRSKKGYGRLQSIDSNGGSSAAHRFSYELHNGPIPDGLIVMHKCDNPPCCNPSHLQVGTHKENTHDMMRKGRGNWVGSKGSKNGNSILTEEIVLEIKYGKEMGSVLAKRHGVSQSTISAIRKGRIWKEV